MKRAHCHDGFSLVELLIAMAIAAVVGGSIVTMMLSQTWFTSTQNRNMFNAEALRETVHFMTDEIQLAGSGAAAPYITVAHTDNFVFKCDVDNDGAADTVTYDYDAGAEQLTRTLNNGTTDVLLSNVSAFNFTYYGLGNVLLDPTNNIVDQITAVKIDLTLNVADTTTAFTSGRIAPQSMVALVTIRNRLLD